MRQARPQEICTADALDERGSHCFRVQYRGKPRDAIVVRHAGEVYGYLNQCVHMPRRLDCEDPHVFDPSGRFVRCSMHGIIYDPASGMCQSEICAGESLTSIAVVETGGVIYLQDRYTTLDAPQLQPAGGNEP
jgi:nitrite reductase/ring-hydroxylating ferredoxin subunit